MVLGIRVVMFLDGDLVLEIFVRWSVHLFEGCSKDFLYLFFSFSFRYIVPVLSLL